MSAPDPKQRVDGNGSDIVRSNGTGHTAVQQVLGAVTGSKRGSAMADVEEEEDLEELEDQLVQVHLQRRIRALKKRKTGDAKVEM